MATKSNSGPVSGLANVGIRRAEIKQGVCVCVCVCVFSELETVCLTNVHFSILVTFCFVQIHDHYVHSTPAILEY